MSTITAALLDDAAPTKAVASPGLNSKFAAVDICVCGDEEWLTHSDLDRTTTIASAKATDADVLCKCCTCTDQNDAAVCARRRNRG